MSSRGYVYQDVSERECLNRQNHPFIDGDKRMAFAVTYTFFAVNGAHITAKTGATYAFIIGLHEAGTFELARLADWFRTNVTLAPPGPA